MAGGLFRVAAGRHPMAILPQCRPVGCRRARVDAGDLEAARHAQLPADHLSNPLDQRPDDRALHLAGPTLRLRHGADGTPRARLDDPVGGHPILDQLSHPRLRLARRAPPRRNPQAPARRPPPGIARHGAALQRMGDCARERLHLLSPSPSSPSAPLRRSSTSPCSKLPATSARAASGHSGLSSSPASAKASGPPY